MATNEGCVEKSFFRSTSCSFLRFFMNRAQTLNKHSLANSAVVFSPHPDDETLACGGTILQKRQEGADLTIVFLTDGRRSHMHLISEEELKVIRKSEALEAGRVLGVEDLVFLDSQNGQLEANSESSARQVLEILEDRKPQEIYVPYYQEPVWWGSGDHTATNKIVLSALKAYGKKLVINEYPVGFWVHWPWINPTARTRRLKLWELKTSFFKNWNMLTDFRCKVNVKGVLSQKRLALDQYKSQMTRLIPDPAWKTLADLSGGDFLGCFQLENEFFYRHKFAGFT